MIKKVSQVYYLFFIYFVILSCKNDSKSNVDLSGIDGKFTVTRIEKELFSIDTNNFAVGYNQLVNKYPDFMKIYTNNIFEVDSAEVLPFMRGFVTNTQIKKLYDTTNMILPNLDLFTNEMEEHIKHLKYYFKDFQTPHFYTFLSEYTLQQFIFSDKGKNAIGIGLDMYLGEKYPYKNIDPTNPSFSDYLVRAYNQPHMSSKVLDIMIEDILTDQLSTSSKMIDRMINNGKKYYLKKRIAPNMKDDLFYQLPQDKVTWLADNELEIWSFLVDNNLLYETSPMKVNKFVSPAPNSPGMPLEAPGGAANYIGYMIVKSACDKMDWRQVMKIIDGQKLLDIAKYKPKR
jgi:hypothetical protein